MEKKKNETTSVLVISDLYHHRGIKAFVLWRCQTTFYNLEAHKLQQRVPENIGPVHER